MKLLKYVMTHDSGLAPNPFFEVCSLALCTPNHMNARLNPDDWIVGHSSKTTGNRLVYAMKLTQVLSMDEYFKLFPQKHPDPYGSIEQQYGDNMYFRENNLWRRSPSAQHNRVENFEHDQDRRIYLAEGNDRFWYFGAANPMPFLPELLDQFPWLIQSRQGFTYVRDVGRIQAFAQALASLGESGLLGTPRDQEAVFESKHLISISPEPIWLDARHNEDLSSPAARDCKRTYARPKNNKPGC